MEKWNKITNSHTVNIFRDIVHDYWGLDVHFYNKSGVSQDMGEGFHFQNPLCSLINSNKKAAEECLLFRTHNFKNLNGSQETFVCKFYTNLKLIAVQITVKGNYIGAMVCSGMQFPITNEQREESIRRITKLGLSRTELLKSYDKITISESLTEKHVLRFMKMVIKDISPWCEILFDEDNFDEDNTEKNQEPLMERSGRPLFVRRRNGRCKSIIGAIDRRRNGKYKSIIGTGMNMKKIFDKLDLIESTESPVLILGETGTGKELIATAIHYNSVRKDKAFVIQNCSAFSDTILSSELFGHEKGAFTGAVSDKKGIFEIADGGTLFLDEIGDLSIDVHGKTIEGT